MSHKYLFARALAAAPGRLHFAAHSHHFWPDVSRDGQLAAWDDAARAADLKWDKVMGPVWADAQGHIARELRLPDPGSIAFATNTHDFLVRIFASLPCRASGKMARVLASDGEFHSFSRQMRRWVEAGEAMVDTAPLSTIAEMAENGGYDLIFVSQVQFNSGLVLADVTRLAALAKPDGPWVVVDGYHGFMALDNDLSAVADKIFYLGGGYKYAMAGEGVCFLHAPDGFAPRPIITGWFAAFDHLAESGGALSYAPGGARFLGSTFDPSGLYRFNAVQAMLAAEGLTTTQISAHVAALQTQFIHADALPHFRLLNPLDGGPHARFLAYQGEDAAALHDALAARQILTDVRGDVLRIGFAIYHDPADVTALISAIGAITDCT
ncbi:MAG: class V aminotransferase [Sphingomonadaceae bacterium]|nr:class V aminotransferase [Sphingomonadaceae bacterium]